MRTVFQVVVVCLALGLHHAFLFPLATYLSSEEEKEIDLFGYTRFSELLDVIASNGIWVIPGKEAIIGREAMKETFKWMKTVDYDHYNSTIIRKHDMGEYLCERGSYTGYSKDNTLIDEATFLKFYKRQEDGSLLTIVDCLVSRYTPWPVRSL